ncbi:MAG: hypothetical protein KC587_11855, partial [Nitrospira sp.]|nr:hypothetical protein [Nitrospira sp.]
MVTHQGSSASEEFPQKEKIRTRNFSGSLGVFQRNLNGSAASSDPADEAIVNLVGEIPGGASPIHLIF